MDGIRTGNPGNIFVGLLQLTFEPLSVLLFCVAFGGMVTATWGAVRRRPMFGDRNVLVACLIAYAGMTFVHALVHVEPRHLGGVIWVPQIFAILSSRKLIVGVRAWHAQVRGQN